MIFLYFYIIILVIIYIGNNITYGEILPKIIGTLKDGTQIEICSDATKVCTDVAYSYEVGEGPKEILFWSPFGEPGKAGEYLGNIIARVMRELVYTTRDPLTNEDTISCKLEVVSWSDLSKREICTNNNPCPTMMLLGTTQFAYRVKHGDVLNLDSFYDKYLAENHEPLTDSFLKQVYYDYNIDGHYVAVPLILDTRLLYFNRTTFDRLHLEYPPPHGSWGTESEPYYKKWTWEKFVEYIKKISAGNLGGKPFTFTGQYDEEMKLFNMIIRNSNIETITANKTCGYLNDEKKIIDIIEKIVIPIFSQLGSDWYPNDNITQQFINSSKNINPIDLPRICCRDTSEYSNGFTGMIIESPNSMKKINLYNQGNLENTIAAAYVPGSSSYFGGSGIIITKASPPEIQEYAWELILLLINKNLPYITEIGVATNMFPPYDSLFDIQTWESDEWNIVKTQVRHSLQIQYPRQTFYEFGELEDRHPVRLMLLEILKKNVDPLTAVERCCELMNSTLAGECSENDWTYTIGKCNSSQKRKVIFNWSKIGCYDGVPLPKATNIPCPYIFTFSGIGGSMAILSIIGIISSIVYIYLFYSYRKTEPMLKASVKFSIIIIVGSILIYSSVLFQIGYPNPIKCGLSVWFLIIGLGLAFGGLVVKAHRIYKIFNNSKIIPMGISDKKLFKILSVIMLCEVIALFVWTSINQPLTDEYVDEHPIKGHYRTISYEIIQCKRNSGMLSVTLLYVFNLIILIYGLWLSYKTWSIPQSYSETKFVCTAIFFASFSVILYIPVVWLSPTNEFSFMIKSLILNFATGVSISVFCIPKIRSAKIFKTCSDKKTSSNNNFSDNLKSKSTKARSSYSNILDGTITCPHCGMPIERELYQLDMDS